MADDNKDKQIKPLIDLLKQLTQDNESFKLKIKKAQEENKDDVKVDFTNLEILAKFTQDKENMIQWKIKVLQDSKVAKGTRLRELKGLMERWKVLCEQKKALEERLDSILKASPKQLDLIQKLAYKSSAIQYCDKLQSTIDSTHSKLKSKGINIPEVLKEISKKLRLSELSYRITELDSEIEKLRKKKEKLQQSSDSSLDELE